MMSPTSIGFVFLFGFLHVCSGKSVITVHSSISDFSQVYFGLKENSLSL